MIIPEFQRPSLSPEQLEALSILAKTLTPDQASWVSGYFAGIEYSARNRTEGSREVFGQLGSDAGPELKSEATSRTVTVLYGSETGNSTQLARSIAEQGQALGLKISAADMADYKVRRLKDEQDVLIVTSTYGEGDPPQPAVRILRIHRKPEGAETVRAALCRAGARRFHLRALLRSRQAPGPSNGRARRGTSARPCRLRRRL